MLQKERVGVFWKERVAIAQCRCLRERERERERERNTKKYYFLQSLHGLLDTDTLQISGTVWYSRALFFIYEYI